MSGWRDISITAQSISYKNPNWIKIKYDLALSVINQPHQDPDKKYTKQ